MFMKIHGADSKCGSGNRFTMNLIVLLLTAFTTTYSMSMENTSDQFWLNSCGRSSRHKRGSDFPRQEIKVLIFQLNNLINKDLQQLYPHHSHKSSSTSNCINVKAFMSVLNNQQRNMKNVTVILHQMLIKLEKFSDKLMNVPVKTDSKFDETERLRIHEKNRMGLRNVICVFNTSVTNSGINSLEAESFDQMIPDLNEDCIQKTFDSSTVQPIDVDFFKNLLKFLRLSQGVLRMSEAKYKRGKKNGGKKRLGKNNGAKKTRRKKNKSRNNDTKRETQQ